MSTSRQATLGIERTSGAFSNGIDTPETLSYYARPFNEHFGQISQVYGHDISKRVDLRPAVRNLLEVQMHASSLEFNYAQYVRQSALGSYVESNRSTPVNRGVTVGDLYDRCNDGLASPYERLMAASFPVESIEIARLSHYDTPGDSGESEMNSAVNFAISQLGGVVYEYPSYYDSKIKALDAHPILDLSSEFIKYVSLHESVSSVSQEENAPMMEEPIEVKLGAMAARVTESSSEVEPVQVPGVDFLEAMVVSIKYDVGEIATNPINDSEKGGSKKFVVRHRQKVLIEYSKLPEDIRDQLLRELKNVPAWIIFQRINAKENESATDAHENPVLSHLNEDSGLTNLIRRIIETEYENIELMTSIYYAVHVESSLV